MKPATEFTQPISSIGGTYGQINWPGYIHKQKRVEGDRHIGDDYNGPGGGNTDLGVDVFAVANGVIEKVIPWNGKLGHGNHIFIKHELAPYLQAKYNCKVLFSHYAHLEAFRCFEGQEVSKGQVIAKLGNTGTKYAHLHLEIRKPTGRGYEDYPSDKPVDWINKYYFTPFTFIEENKKEPIDSQAPTTENSQPPAESPAETAPQPTSDSTTGDHTESGNNTVFDDNVVPDDTGSHADEQPTGVDIPDDNDSAGDTFIPAPAQKKTDFLSLLKKFWESVKKFFLRW